MKRVYGCKLVSVVKKARARLLVRKKRVVVCYLRFLNSFIPSISVMYSNPFSISCVACVSAFLLFHVFLLTYQYC